MMNDEELETAVDQIIQEMDNGWSSTVARKKVLLSLFNTRAARQVTAHPRYKARVKQKMDDIHDRYRLFLKRDV